MPESDDPWEPFRSLMRDADLPTYVAKFLAREGLEGSDWRYEIETWFAAMSTTRWGKIIAYNWIKQSYVGSPGSLPLKDFFEAFAEWLSTSARKVSPSWRNMGEFVRDRWPEEPSSFAFCLAGGPIDTVDDLSRVVPASDVIQAALDPENADHLECPHDEFYTPYLMEGELEQRLGGLPMPEPWNEQKLCWVTRSAELEQMRLDHQPDRLAGAVQEQLGLWYKWDLFLHELVYPPDLSEKLVSDHKLRTPTIMDNPDYTYFWPAPGPWGKTVNLRTGKKGLSEAVHDWDDFADGDSLCTGNKVGYCESISPDRRLHQAIRKDELQGLI